MTAGPNDAGGAKSSFHTLRSRNTVTKDMWWSIWWGHTDFSHQMCSLWEFNAPALAQIIYWVANLLLIFILPSVLVVLLVLEFLLDPCLLGDPGNKSTSLSANNMQVTLSLTNVKNILLSYQVFLYLECNCLLKNPLNNLCSRRIRILLVIYFWTGCT